MDHNDAVQLQAAVKYVLGELPQAQLDEYEEHFFDCAECSRDVQAAAVFADNARSVFRQEAREERLKASGRGWFAWLKPVVAVPAFAALLLVIAYQNAVTIPQAKKQAGLGAGQFISSTFSLQMANVRGEEVKVQIHRNESFALKFDFTPASVSESYVCQLQDEAGRSLLQVAVPGGSTNREAQVVVPGGLAKPGEYSLVFTGSNGTSGAGSKGEVLRLRFTVEFLD